MCENATRVSEHTPFFPSIRRFPRQTQDAEWLSPKSTTFAEWICCGLGSLGSYSGLSQRVCAGRVATAGRPAFRISGSGARARSTYYPPARAPVLPRGSSFRSAQWDHVKGACGPRDVTRPVPIRASVYVGTSRLPGTQAAQSGGGR